MTMKFLIAGAGLAALAAAAPASAQYGYPYGTYNPYGTYSPYTPGYGAYGAYGANITQVAANQCTAAVQARLNNRTSIAGILGSLVGVNSTGRVLTVSSVNPSSTRVRVRGLASSGRMAAYNPYGYGYYGAVGSQYGQPADLSFRCDVDYSGRIRDIDIDRRR